MLKIKIILQKKYWLQIIKSSYMKTHRTFGWIQNPASTDNLKKVVSIFLKDSDINRYLVNKKIPFLIKNNLVSDINLFKDFIDQLSQQNIELSYSSLKGKGSINDRKNAKCSGIIQATLDAQKLIILGNKQVKKPYSDDWTADGFLRWAISIGFIIYNSNDDTCKISELGKQFALASDINEINKILGVAYLSYPPVVRILTLLKQQGHLTKFEIGQQLGFVGEAGFSTIPQNIWVASYVSESNTKIKSKIRNNEEGSSDKYARMICSWLCNIGWVKKAPKEVAETYGNKQYSCIINQSYIITLEGINNLNKAYGLSKHKRIPKIIFFEMLATKVSNIDYVRLRRAYIIECINKKYCSVEEIQKYLNTKNMIEYCSTIQDDINGLMQIGLNIKVDNNKYKLVDIINNFNIPVNKHKVSKNDIDIIKERVRNKLQLLNHKYLILVDLAFSGKEGNREFEIQTINLLTNELLYCGKRLGDTRKPDSIVYFNNNGLIIDNKAYSKGYSLQRSQVDEMVRYLQENNDRDVNRNANQWWLEFPINVNVFNYLFISSYFKGNFKDRLKEIYASSKISGAVINIENLLYLAEQIKRNNVLYEDSFYLFNTNDEIIIKI